MFARPQWRTLTKRSRDYVNKLLHQICENGGKVLLGTPVSKVVREPDRVTIFSQACDPQTFDQVVFATHAPTTLELLGSGATEQESNILGAFQYSSNTAYIHYDPRLMPTNRTVWSSWNFIGKRKPDANGLASSNEQLPGDQPACVSYWLNKLQNLHNFHAPVPDIFITLNPVTPIDPDKRIVELTYEHPQFTEEAVEAQPLIQSVLQGKNRSWFCGAYARYGFHEDALTTGLDVAERLSKHTIIRPWHSKQALAINDHRRLYELPHSPLRSSYFVFLGSLMVLNTVMARLGQGLRRIAQRMVDHDPIVDVAGGDGRLYRFGPPNIRSRSRSLLALNDLPPPSGSSTVQEPLRARVTVKSPRLLARIAEALRQGHELAPTAAAAFAASEFDCPTPTDLSVALRALFIADGLDLDPSKERKGRAKFAESLLYTIVGGIKKVFALPTHTRLPELTTCISNVVYPSWWLQMDETSNAVSTKNGASVMVSRGSTTDLEMSTNTLELLGDLAETTVSLLQSNKGFLATIVVLTQERIAFVTRKAELLLVRRQVSIVLLEDFLKQRKLEFELSAGLDQNQKQYDRIISPAWINVFQSSECGSLVEALEFLSSMASPGATVEMAATVFGSYRPSKPIDQGHWTDSLFCGDKGFLLWRMQDIIEAIEISHFELQSVSFMNNEEAAMDVFELIERVYSSLATEKLEPLETRLVLAQMCLWEAALDVKYLRRMALRLKLA